MPGAPSPPVSQIMTQVSRRSLIRTIGAASTVLLTNTGGVLPLHKPRSIAIVGESCSHGRVKTRGNTGFCVGSGAGSNPLGPNACLDRACDIGVLAMGWGSGYVHIIPHAASRLKRTFSTANYPYLIAVSNSD